MKKEQVKKSFIDILSSATPEEINDLILAKSKVKLLDVIERI